MTSNVGDRKKGKTYKVTDRYASQLIGNDYAVLAVKEKEEKAKPETKEEKPKGKTITKAVE